MPVNISARSGELCARRAGYEAIHMIRKGQACESARDGMAILLHRFILGLNSITGSLTSHCSPQFRQILASTSIGTCFLNSLSKTSTMIFPTSFFTCSAFVSVVSTMISSYTVAMILPGETIRDRQEFGAYGVQMLETFLEAKVREVI
jgi:hypothetical protein